MTRVEASPPRTLTCSRNHCRSYRAKSENRRTGLLREGPLQTLHVASRKTCRLVQWPGLWNHYEYADLWLTRTATRTACLRSNFAVIHAVVHAPQLFSQLCAMYTSSCYTTLLLVVSFYAGFPHTVVVFDWLQILTCFCVSLPRLTFVFLPWLASRLFFFLHLTFCFVLDSTV